MRTLLMMAVVMGIYASSAHSETVNVALVSRTFFNLPLWVADKKGFFKEEGIEAIFEIVNNAEMIKAGLQSGTKHISVDTPEVVMIDAYSGGSLRIIAGNARKLPHFIITRPSIKTLQDLRGANFGVLSLKEGTANIIPKIAAAAGLTNADYKITPVGGAPTRWKLLQEGKIDAGLQPFPLSYEAEAAGFTNLGWTGNYEPEWQFVTFNVNNNWARRNAETVSKFLRAVLRGQAYADAHREEAAQIVAAELRSSVALTERALADDERLGILDRRLDWSEPGLNRVFAILKQDGAVPADSTFDLGKVVEAAYLRSAQATIRIPPR